MIMKNKIKQQKMESITVHPYDWTVKDCYGEDGKVAIFCWALDKQSKPHLLRIHDFPAFCYIELPIFLDNRVMNWTQDKKRIVYEAICEKLGEDRPFMYAMEDKEKLYYYRGPNKKYPMLRLLFHNLYSMNMCRNKLKYPFKVKGLKNNDEFTNLPVKVWETNISIVRKFLTLRNCKFSQWFTVNGIKVKDEDKISTLEHEYVIDRKTLNPIPAEETMSWLTQPTIFSYDLETYSDRHNSMPDALCAKHVIYMVSVVFQRFKDPTSRKKEIILFGDCSHTDMANVIKVNSETELINTLQSLILKYDPDITVGYNTYGYDNIYLENRIKRRLQDWKPLGRLIGEPTTMKTVSWSSSAYKNQDFTILEMNGRISVDMLPVIRRDFKFPLYNLDYVSNHFLKRGKYPVKAKQMFETFELQQCLSADFTPETGDVPESFVQQCKKKNINESKEIRQLWNTEYKIFALDEMKKVVEYCVVDSDLVMDLFEKINVWINLIQLSNVMAVTPSELFTRGTGIRMVNQVYDEASRDGIVLDQVDIPYERIEGGLVVEPKPGMYRYICCVDYKSLYPSIISTHNFDHRTIIPPELMDKIPDEQCHVIEWDEELEEEESDSDNEEKEEESDNKKLEKKKKKKMRHYKYKFVKEPLGIMPRLLIRLTAERNKVREKQKHLDKESLEYSVLEQTQLGIKLSSNAFYGACASSFSDLSHVDIGRSITAKAREYTRGMNAFLENKGYTIVYGDTDSTMPDLGITDPKKAWEIAKKVTDEINERHTGYMAVELEAIFDTMFCIKKKMYMCILLDKNGNRIEKEESMKIRGITLARRDNCKLQREFYKTTILKIMKDLESMKIVFDTIVEKCIQVASHSIPWEDFVMIKGLGSHYKNSSYMMNIFAREMEKSGNPLTPGDRVPYVVVETKNGEDKLGFKMRSTDLFLERAVTDNPERIDYVYYLEKVIKNGIEKQLFQVGFNKEIEEIQKKFHERDINLFIYKMNEKGYEHLIQPLMEKYENNKEKVVDHLMSLRNMEKIVKPLYNYYVRRRQGRKKRISTRIDKNPVQMMVDLIRLKRCVTDSIKAGNYKLKTWAPSPPKKLILKIVGKC